MNNDWNCIICDKLLSFDSIFIDLEMKRILERVRIDKAILNDDGVLKNNEIIDLEDEEVYQNIMDSFIDLTDANECESVDEYNNVFEDDDEEEEEEDTDEDSDDEEENSDDVLMRLMKMRILILMDQKLIGILILMMITKISYFN